MLPVVIDLMNAILLKPAKPLQDFSVQLIDEVFQAKWTQSEWDVILFYAKQKPEYAVGTMSNGQPISKVLQALLKNITKINGCEKQMIEILFATSDNQALFENILSVFMAALREPRQLEQLCVKYVEITESLTDRQLNRFEQLLLETPGAVPIATRLCARKIASSKNPEDEFWRFYDNQRSRISANSGFTIEPMILISLAIAVGFYVVASAIHLVFHECGHFFGGLVSKYKLLFFRFGPFNLVKTEKTKIKFTWLKTHGGQCVMYPSQTSTIKYKAYNLGGVIANAIIAALSTLLMLPNNFYLLMMMIELVFVGAYKILVNLIPHKTNGVPNDGYIVKMLDAHIAMRKDYALYLRIYADTFLNKAISPSDYQYERNESLSDDELLYYNEIQEILKSINAQMSKHEIDHCKGIVI